MTQKTRDVGAELLEAITAIKKGQGNVKRVILPEHIADIRQNLHLTQNGFASLMGVSVRTLQEWEQGRRKPNASALALLRIAQKHPEAFIDL